MILWDQLANLISVFSLAAGFMSIVFSLEGHFTFACWAVIGSVVCDGLDGQIARFTNSSSEFGKELDSLVDVVSFGVAPSILGYVFVYTDVTAPAAIADSPLSNIFFYKGFHPLTTLALFVYLFCSVFRLAKYNITLKESLKNCFSGLPTTASGALLASFILMYRKYAEVPNPTLFLFIVLLLAFLMVSRIRYLNLDGLIRLFGKKFFWVVLAFVAVVFVFFPELTVFVLTCGYLITCPFIVRMFVSGNTVPR